MRCWDQSHIPYVVVGGAFLLLFLLFAFRMLRVASDLSRVAVFFWVSWAFDKPDIG
jgi:xanthine/uracil permease